MVLTIVQEAWLLDIDYRAYSRLSLQRIFVVAMYVEIPPYA